MSFTNNTSFSKKKKKEDGTGYLTMAKTGIVAGNNMKKQRIPHCRTVGTI
jgi:hypothetical protein